MSKARPPLQSKNLCLRGGVHKILKKASEVDASETFLCLKLKKCRVKMCFSLYV